MLSYPLNKLLKILYWESKDKMTATLCPCGSKKKYMQCCKVYHDGASPKNALQLMRSRYSAYVLNIPEYIVATTHRLSREFSENKSYWKRSISKFSQDFNFRRLEVLDFKEKNSFATVTFVVHLSQDGENATFTERSLFEKINGKWMYLFGVLAEGRDITLVIPQELKILPLAYYGDSVLKSNTETVKEISPEIKSLVNEMIWTMDIRDGAGIAAPQIHKSLKIFVIRAPLKPNQKDFEPNQVKVFINPKIFDQTKETCKMMEGCLSIPGIEASIERPKEITIEYTTIDGTVIKYRASGKEARVILHEYDHIEGILFIDRLNQEDRLKLEPKLKNLEKRILKANETVD